MEPKQAEYATAARDPVYSMRAVGRRTGLSPHVVRVWERRYRAVEPARTEGNIRLFSEEDVTRLELLRDLTLAGHAIGRIAKLGTPELRKLLASSADGPMTLSRIGPQPRVGQEDQRTLGVVVSSYLEAVDSFDTRRSIDILGRSAASLDRRVFLYEIALPILRQVGDGWASGRFGVVHEHLVSAQLETILHGLRGWSVLDGPRILVATPAGHRHSFGAMAAVLLAAAHGWEPIFLGTDLPVEDLVEAAELSHAAVVVLSLLREVDDVEMIQLEKTLESLSRVTETWLGCPPGHRVASTLANVKVLDDLRTFEAHLDARARKRDT